MPDSPLNMFDFLLLAVLVAGILRGRNRSMSEQLLSLIKWLAILIGCAMVYEPVASVIARAGFFDPASSCLMAFLGLALLVLLFFSFVKRKTEKKYKDELSGEASSY